MNQLLYMGYHSSAGLQVDWNGFYQKIKYVAFENGKATKSKPVKLETSRTVRLPL